MVIGVLVQEDAKGNVAEKKKVKEFMKANIGKLLKYNAWPTRTERQFDDQLLSLTTMLSSDEEDSIDTAR
ncbi:hypothetical protein Tco_1535466, partial [Tanacetum coccineum]